MIISDIGEKVKDDKRAIELAHLVQLVKHAAIEIVQLAREAGCFERNPRRVSYQETSEKGWLIGSAVVESALMQNNARLAGPGMHWILLV